MTSAESIAKWHIGTRQSACILAIFVWSHQGEATSGLDLLGLGSTFYMVGSVSRVTKVVADHGSEFSG